MAAQRETLWSLARCGNWLDVRERLTARKRSCSSNVHDVNNALVTKRRRISEADAYARTTDDLMTSSEPELLSNSISPFTVEDNSKDANAADDQGRTLLHYAVDQDNVEAVRMLLELASSNECAYTVDINAQDKQLKQTVLICAVEKGYEEIVKILLENDDMSRKRREKCVTDFVSATTAGKMFEASCSYTQHPKSLNLNAEDGFGRTALMKAAQMGEAGIVGMLMDCDDLDVYTCGSNGQNALECTLIGHDDSMVNTTELQRKRYTEERLRIMAMLLDKGFNVNATNCTGETVLHAASSEVVSSRQPIFKLVEYLLARGADVNATNREGRTPLHSAIIRGKQAVAKFFTGGNLQIKDNFLKTAFDYLTCCVCRKEIIETIPVLNSRLKSEFQPRKSKRELFAEIDLLDTTKTAQFSDNAVEYWYRNMCDIYNRTRGKSRAKGCCHVNETEIRCLGLNSLRTFLEAGRDKRRRTVAHLFLIFTCDAPGGEYDAGNRQWDQKYAEHKPGSIRIIKELLPSIANIQDYLGRTSLHYYSLLFGNTEKSFNDGRSTGESIPMSILSLLLGACDVRARDKYGRAVLHYLSMSQAAQRIVAEGVYTRLGADPAVKDVYKQTPNDILRDYEAYKRSVSKFNIHLMQFRKLRAGMNTMPLYNIAVKLKHIRTSPSVVLEYVDEAESWRTQQCLLVSDYWQASQYDAVSDSAQEIAMQLNSFVSRLVADMYSEDPRLQSSVLSVGSAYEGTKVKAPNEFDVNVLLKDFSDICKVSSSPACPKGYALLKRSIRNSCQKHSHDKFEDFFDESQNLITSKLKHIFEQKLKKSVRRIDFWKSEIFFELDLVKDPELYSINEDRLCVTLKLVINEPIDGLHACFPISVDIAPCIQIAHYWPDDAEQNVSESLGSSGCNFVFDQPQKIYPWIPVSIPYARVSFARAESSVIRSCSAVVKAAFKVTKRLVDVYDSKYSSHVIKTAVFHCVAAACRDKRKRCSYWSTNSESVTSAQIKYITQTLFTCSLLFHHQGFVPSYFFPALCMRVWSHEEFLLDFALRVHSYRKSLGHDSENSYINESVREKFSAQSPNSAVHSPLAAVGAFKMAHALCWLCYAEGSPLIALDFFHVVNPCVENFDSRVLARKLYEIEYKSIRCLSPLRSRKKGLPWKTLVYRRRILY